VADTDDTKGGAKTETVPASGSGSGGGSSAPKQAEAAVAQPENRRARRAAAKQRRPGGIAERPGSRETLDATEKVDDAFSRAADRGARWLGDHFNIFQWLIVASIAGWVGWQIYSWRAEKAAVRTTDDYAEALRAELGRVGDTDETGHTDQRGNVDARKGFATDEARLAAATEGYKKVIADSGKKPAAMLAQLGLAGILYDQGKYPEAQKAYEDVLTSDLAKTDLDAKGRALEGVGLSLEAKGDKDAALKRFRELENADIAGFKELAQYHQGRLLYAKGETAGAVEKLKKVLEKLGKETQGTEDPGYLVTSAKSLLERIDPKSVPAPSPDEALRNALESFQKKLPPGVTRLPSMPAPASP
jgi:tetratricopeptide (TPR) repeat protein